MSIHQPGIEPSRARRAHPKAAAAEKNTNPGLEESLSLFRGGASLLRARHIHPLQQAVGNRVVIQAMRRGAPGNPGARFSAPEVLQRQEDAEEQKKALARKMRPKMKDKAGRDRLKAKKKLRAEQQKEQALRMISSEKSSQKRKQMVDMLPGDLHKEIKDMLD